MSEFDAELYLRLLAERMLLDHRLHAQRAPWDSPLAAATQALVAVGAISAEAADAVLDDHDLAIALRSNAGEPGQRRLRGGSRRPRVGAGAAPLGPRRVVACDARIERPDGTLHVRFVSLSEEAARVGVGFDPHGGRPAPTARRNSIGIRLAGQRSRPGPGLRQVTLTDDRNGTANANFSGIGTDEGWRGQLEADQPLAIDTGWIELDGERIELSAGEQPVEISVERLPEQDPATRQLWRLAMPEQPHRTSTESIQPAIDALVACDALSIDDPAIDDARAVLAATGFAPVGSTGFGPVGSTPVGRALPEPWRSMLVRRGLQDGPDGALLASAVTPPFDGISVALTSLESTADAWAIEVEVVPGVVMDHRGFGGPINGRRRVDWWARDDRGNHYLGQVGRWSGSDGGGAGEVCFWPALDPRAAELAVMPTAETERAVIRLPLDWGRGERAGR
jgi:hypothetical protein